MNVIRILAFIGALANMIITISNHDISAALGWSVASLYTFVDAIEGLLSHS